MKRCTIENCSTPNNYYAHGLCNKHYIRFKKNQSMTDKSVYELTTLEKFESKFTKTDTCWIWHSLGKNGRCNTFMLNGKNRSAHTAAWILYIGEIPEGKIVCHTCDDGRCVNPDHLWTGTYKENTADMFSKGRARVFKGEETTQSILNNKIVTDIYTSELSNAQLARKYGVARKTISDIVTGKQWKHVTSSLKKSDNKINGRIKLSDIDVIAIRESKLRPFQLAPLYNVSTSCIENVVNEKTFKHLL